MAALVTIEAVVIALITVLVAGLLRSHAEILRRLHDLGAGVGEPTGPSSGMGTARAEGAPMSAVDVAGTTPSGDPVQIGVAGARGDTLLAFLSSGCTTCDVFWDAFRQPSLQVPGDARLVVVTRGEAEESPARLAKLAPPGVPLVMSSRSWADYQVPVAPYFMYLAGPSGEVVGEGAAATWERVSSLMAQALADGRQSGAGGAGRERRGGRGDDARREARADHDLLAAGIRPGHPSLHRAPPKAEP